MRNYWSVEAFICLLQAQTIVRLTKVYVGLPLLTELRLLKFGAQVAQVPECVAVVSVFLETQEHTLRKQLR
jgi:hypothetical protein